MVSCIGRVACLNELLTLPRDTVHHDIGYIISKTLEKLVHQLVFQYLQYNNILKNEQSGVRNKYSTQTSLHLILEDLHSRMDNGEVIGLVALDIRKAFDTVDHKILIDK